jgi:hypothetical protein
MRNAHIIKPNSTALSTSLKGDGSSQQLGSPFFSQNPLAAFLSNLGNGRVDALAPTSVRLERFFLHLWLGG